jgi:membrane-bound lytic murein transglycosylase D
MRQLLFVALLGAWLLPWPASASDTAVAYTLIEGETLETVAGQFDVTVEDIMITNGFETEEIEVGTVIYIPPPHARGLYDPDAGTYLIAEGDELGAIAERFQTTVAALEGANDLETSEIIAGATLLIP